MLRREEPDPDYFLHTEWASRTWLRFLRGKLTFDEQDRAQVSELAKRVQEETGETVEIAYVDQGYTGENAADAAGEHGIKLEAVKLPTAKRGFVLLPRRWVAERSFGWLSRFRRLARDYERLPETLAGLHYVAFVILMLKNVAEILT
jgi:transposase